MPTDQNGNMNIDPFVDCLKQRPDHVFTQIVLMGNDLKLINNPKLFGVHNFNILNSYQNEFLNCICLGLLINFSFGFSVLLSHFLTNGYWILLFFTILNY